MKYRVDVSGSERWGSGVSQVSDESWHVLPESKVDDYHTLALELL